MPSNLKTWAPLIVAIVLGGIAAKIGHDMLSRKPSERVVVQKVTHVVVANADMPPGTSLKPTDLMVDSVADGAVPPGTFDTAERLTNRVTTLGLRKGQPIFENMLAPIGSSQGLTAIVPDGMRAVTMEINEFSGVAGLLVPGCRVDVVASIQMENGQMMSRTVARSLQIVAVGRKYADTPHDSKTPDRDDADAPIAHSVTLLVTPKEAEILDLAAHTGTPRLVLRGSRDSKSDAGDSGDGVSVAELRGASRPSGVKSMLTTFFESLSNATQQRVGSPAAAAVAAVVPVIAPATQPKQGYRQVTVIRHTQEQLQRVEVAPQPKAQPNFVNVDTGEAIPDNHSSAAPDDQ